MKNSSYYAQEIIKDQHFNHFFGPNDLTHHDNITGNCSYEKTFENGCMRVNLKAKEDPFL